MVSARVRVAHQFGVANSSGTSGTINRINREVVRTFRAILSKRHSPVNEWSLAVGAVQRALNSVFRERVGTTPFQMMTGRPPPTAMSVLADTAAGEWTIESLDVSPGETEERVTGWVSEQETMQSRVVECVRAQRQRVRKIGNREELPAFAVGEHVLVARVRKIQENTKAGADVDRPVACAARWFDARVRRGRHRHERNQGGAYRANACVSGLIADYWGECQGCIRDLQAPGRVRDGRRGRRWQGSGAAGGVPGSNCLALFRR